MKKFIIILLLGLMVTGCATTWNHPNWNQEKYREDERECQSDGRMKTYLQGAFKSGWLDYDVWQEHFNNCMKLKGYSK